MVLLSPNFCGAMGMEGGGGGKVGGREGGEGGGGGGGGGGVRQLSGQPLPRRRHGSRNCEGGRGGCASHYFDF